MDRQILSHIRRLKRQLLPNDRLIVFGSQARGDAHPDSDWDLLILLNKNSISINDKNKYAYPFFEIGWDYGTYISVKMYTEKEWSERHFTPFYKNVQKEGVLIN